MENKEEDEHMGRVKTCYYCIGFVAACIVCIALILGAILPDVDHPICVVYRGLPLTWENIAFNGCRFLHYTFVPVLGFLSIVYTALAAGWAFIIEDQSNNVEQSA
jgi:hypothetical protein